MKMRPARAMILEKTGRWSSTPYISAFSSEGAALIMRGPLAVTGFGGFGAFCRRRGLEFAVMALVSGGGQVDKDREIRTDCVESDRHSASGGVMDREM